MANSQEFGSSELKWNLLGDLIITRQTPDVDVPDPLWNEFISVLGSGKVRQIFSFTIGSTRVKATQRKSAADVLKQRELATTVITDSRVTRGILTAVSWLGAKVKAYSWSDLDAAMEAAQLPQDLRPEVRRLAKDYMTKFASEAKSEEN